MARDNEVKSFIARAPAASAGSVSSYFPMAGSSALSPEGPVAATFVGFSWLYESAEAATDNTIDNTIAYTVDGTNFTALFTNANAVGLLDTSAPLVNNINKGNAVIAAGAGVDIAVTQTRVPLAAVAPVLRIVIVTAGTSTVPAVQMAANFKQV